MRVEGIKSSSFYRTVANLPKYTYREWFNITGHNSTLGIVSWAAKRIIVDGTIYDNLLRSFDQPMAMLKNDDEYGNSDVWMMGRDAFYWDCSRNLCELCFLELGHYLWTSIDNTPTDHDDSLEHNTSLYHRSNRLKGVLK